jgi:glycosyltransferase involved in cell wall biosynthesis
VKCLLWIRSIPEADRPPQQQLPLTVALLPAGDRFEDFHDKIGVSLEAFRVQLAGGWLFNNIKALRSAGVRTVLIYMSARVHETIHFTHVDTGAPVWVLPSPRLHQRVRHVQRRFFPNSGTMAAAASYLATPPRTLAGVLRRERCDAILCQEYEQARFDTCVLLGRVLRLPVFAMYQGANETRSAVERLIRTLSVRCCDGLVIASRDEIARVQVTYRVASQKIATVPNPVDVVAVERARRQATRTELGIGGNTRVVAWHGRVQIPKKGLDVLLDAWGRICSEQPEADVLLLLIGSGRDADALRRRLRLNTKVLWIDRYVFDRRQLWSYLSAADLYTIPSRYEGFAVAVLEAMACGLPIVASDAEGVVDALPRGEDDGGIVVHRGDPQALAAALRRLLDDPALAARLGRIAEQRVEEEFSLEVVGRKLRQFLFPGRTFDGAG